jgi:transposase, IS605 orfB family
MIVKRIVKFNIKKNHVDYNYIKQQLIESKEIYNYANYIIRQLFFKKSKNHRYSLDFITEYPELKDLFTQYIEEDKQFTSLFNNIICKFARLKDFSVNTKIVQSITRRLNSDWNSYWALLNLVKNNQYDKDINIPKYKKQYNLVEYNNQVLSKKKLKLGFIGTDKMKQGIKISNSHKELHCKCFRIFYKNNNFVCELIYEKEINDQTDSTGKAASVDLGLENLFTVAFNYNKKGISFKGTKLKSINQYFNKEKSKLQSLLPKNQYSSKRINHLFYKRNEQLRNIIGFYANKLIKILLEEEISTLIIGHNKGWKDKINIGKVNNQNFVSIPFNKVIDIIKYKAEDFGIECIEQEESYTSKASFLDNDNIPDFNEVENQKYTFSGKRITRNLYQTKNNQIIDADLNGALNIMKKANVKTLTPLNCLKFNNIFTNKLV